ncbi:MAG TPA: C69 family dipeptidase [Acidobacteriota bacterium]|nr:C69 family dipeptidase [Acidobacteriota bacterium]
MRRRALALTVALGFLLIGSQQAAACSSFMVTKGASTDGSVMVTYTCDAEFHPHLEYIPAADYGPGDSLEITSWGGEVRGKVAQVPHTYAVVQLMNEHQVAIGETTFGGREELGNPEGMLGYYDLMTLALQRAKTAREAVDVMTGLAAEYGYRGPGESFSIADPQEIWYMEMIGPGEGGDGALWVALRVPDGYICGHANKARIGTFPLGDPANCVYSDNVVSFAVDKGYYNPDSGEPFRYCDAYCPDNPRDLRYTETRVWSMFRRSAPSQDFSPDYHRGVEGAEPYPLWIKPDAKISVAGVMDIMRDHYEGTDYDMTVGVDAGPFASPYRWRPLDWEVDSVPHGWERPISTQQTAYSFISQSRSWLPDPVGGVFWYGVDDTYFTCYIPLYCGISDIPHSFTVGSLREFSWESAWWVFNFVANYTNLKYSYMIEDVRQVQSDLEGAFLAFQPTVETTAQELAASDPALLTRYLTDYSVGHAENVVDRWRKLGEFLICKYNDGYVKDTTGRAQELGYPERWRRTVAGERPEQFKIPQWESDTLNTSGDH